LKYAAKSRMPIYCGILRGEILQLMYQKSEKSFKATHCKL